MKITRDFRPLSDRYSIDCGRCSYANGFAQIDTKQDAVWFGTWGRLPYAPLSASPRAT